MVVPQARPNSRAAFNLLRALSMVLQCCLIAAFTPCGPRARFHVSKSGSSKRVPDAVPLMQQHLFLNGQLHGNEHLPARVAANVRSGRSLMSEAVNVAPMTNQAVEPMTNAAVETLTGEILELKRRINILYACSFRPETKLLAKELLERVQEAFVPEHPEVRKATKAYVNVLRSLRHTEEAEALNQELFDSEQGEFDELVQNKDDVHSHAELWARQLQTDGFVVVPSKIQVDIDELRTACHARLEELLNVVEEAGGDPLEQNYGFAEICHRKRSRWDMRMPNEPVWTKFCAEAFQATKPIIQEISGSAPRLDSCGVIISRSGAIPQSFHSDGSQSIFNVFVPLVDIAAGSDGTEFWAGSHMMSPEKAMSNLVSGEGDVAATAVAPAVEAGSMLIFDYRVQHRGLASVGRERAYAYVAIATDTGTDDHNFPPESAFDATEEDCAQMPYHNDGGYRPFDWPELTASQQRVALRTAWQLLNNGLRLSLNPASELTFDEEYQSEIRQAEEIAQTMVLEYCKLNELDPMHPRSQYEAASALQAQMFQACRQDDSKIVDNLVHNSR